MRSVMRMFIPWTAWLLLVVPALVRVTNLVAPEMWFSIDPRQFVLPTLGLGPAGSMTLDLLSITGVILALLHEILSGRRLDRLAIVLWLVPAPVIWWHAGASLNSVWLGAGWLSAMGVAVGLLHLGRDGVLRTLSLAAAMALVAPLAIKASFQFFVEHPLTAEEFERAQEQVLRAHGWTPDSSEAATYRRRLGQAEATGWFAISNIFGTLAAGIAVFWVSTLVTAARSRLSSGWLGLIGIIAAMGMWALALTLSKGAIAVALIGVVFAFLPAVPRAWRRRVARHLGLLTLVLALGLVGGVIFRGAVLGERFTLDSYSLLFRWYYWLGGFRMWLNDPLIGIGPGAFQAGYLIHKPPISPEDVNDAHSLPVMWLTTLGLFALPWLALGVILVRRAIPGPLPRTGAASAEHAAAEDSARPRGHTAAGNAPMLGHSEAPTSGRFEELPRLVWWAPPAVVGVLVAVCGWILSGSGMLADFAFFWWPLGWILFVLIAGALPWIGRHSSWGLLRYAAFAAVLVIALHGLIEMSLTQPGAAPLLLLIAGAAAAGRLAPRSLADPDGTSGRGADATTVDSTGRRWWRRRGPAAAAMAGGARGGDIGLIVATCLLVLVPAAILQRAVATQQAALGRAHAELAQVATLRMDLANAVGGGNMPLGDRITALDAVAADLAALGIENEVRGMLREVSAAASRNDAARANRALTEAVNGLNRGIEQLDEQQILAAIPHLEAAMSSHLELRGSGRSSGSTPATAGGFQAPLWRVPDDLTPLREMARLWHAVALSEHAAGLLVERDEAVGHAIGLAERMAATQPESAGAWFFAANLHRVAASLKVQAPGPSDAGSGGADAGDEAAGAAWPPLDLSGDLSTNIAIAAAMPAPAHLERAVALQRQAVSLDPHGLAPALEMAKLLDAAGHPADALQWYVQVLEIEERMRLDPLRRLTTADRTMVEDRIRALSGPRQ